MKRKLTKRQMINVELAERASNRKAAAALAHHVPKPEQRDLKILFNCECADPDCQERVPLTLAEYKSVHASPTQFIILKDHVEPEVESIEASGQSLAVVEKFSL